jgi:hypothetical protein
MVFSILELNPISLLMYQPRESVTKILTTMVKITVDKKNTDQIGPLPITLKPPLLRTDRSQELMDESKSLKIGNLKKK